MAADQSSSKPKALIFQSYGWRDASDIAQRLVVALREAGYDVWIDRERIREQIRPEDLFPEAIRRGIKEADVILVLISPHSVRLPGDAGNPDKGASVCLNEIVFAHEDRKPIVPVVVVPCEPPFLLNIVRRIDLTTRETVDADFRDGVKEILAAIETARLRGSSAFIPQLERLHPIDFRNELVRGAHSFIGRDWLFARVITWLEGKGLCLMIEGDAGAGKSAAIAELVRRDPEGRLLGYHFCRAEQLTTVQPAEFVRSLASMIGGRIDAYGSQLNSDDLRLKLVGDASVTDPLTSLLSCIINPLTSLPPLGTRYLVVDALDEALAGPSRRVSMSIPQLLAHALPDFPPWLKLVVTTRRDDRITTLFQDAERVVLSDQDPHQRADVATFLEKHLKGAVPKEDSPRASTDHTDIVGVLRQRSAGNFLYAQQIAEAFDRGEFRLDDVRRLPTGLGALFARRFNLCFPDAKSYAVAQRVLGVMLAAKEPLTQRQLTMVGDLRLQEEVRPLLETLTGYIVAQPADLGEPVYTLFHKSLADWLGDAAAGAFRVDIGTGGERLRDWCRGWQRSADPYALVHVIGHLLDADLVDEALGCVRAGLFRKRDARMARNDLQDTMNLVLHLIERSDEKAILELAQSGSPWQRDGTAAALIAAPQSADALIARVVGELMRVPIKNHANPDSDAMSARRMAIRVCEARDFDDELLRIAKDKTPAVRVILAAMLYRHWVRERDKGWRLIDRLAEEMFGFLSLPSGEVLEVLGHMSLAILNNHRDDANAMTRLLSVWRAIAQRVLGGPVVRVVGRGWTLNLLLRPLIELMKRQPAYQPFNTREMAVTFARGEEFRRYWAKALECLEKPESGIAPIVEILETPDLPFDVYLMLVMERALICAGTIDLDKTFDTVERLFKSGRPWFQQSSLYALFHILQNASSVDDDTLRRYAEMTEAFFSSSGATMKTSVGEYSFPPHLAWPEIVAETHRRGRGPLLLQKLLQASLQAHDEQRIERVFKAIDLVCFAYGRATLALSLVEKACGIGAPELEPQIVQTLANIRFQDEALVDEFLERPEIAKLKPLVKATSPSVRGEDIPTWIDGFVVQSMLTSKPFHKEYCAAFRRALTARSTSECLKQILLWVVGLLAAKPAFA